MRNKAFASVLFVIALCRFDAVADTNVSGTISSNTTWAAASSPYVVTGSVTVSSGRTLTVEPGVTVKFNAATYLHVAGRLIAVGTSSAPITFTSSAATPTRGSWGFIRIEGGANPASELAYTTLSYGGATPGGTSIANAVLHLSSGTANLDNMTATESSTAGIRITSAASQTLTNVTASNNAMDGLLIQGTTGVHTISGSTFSANGGYGLNLIDQVGAHVTNSSFTNNASYAIGAEADNDLQGLTGLTATGNGGGTKDAIGYRGGSIVRNETWRSGSLGYVITGNVTVTSPRVLTIEAGSTIRFDTARYMYVGGRLIASGTSSAPITFTSSAATPTRGSWGFIRIEGGTNPASELTHVTISYGGTTPGGVSIANAVLHLSSGTANLDNVTVTESSTAGIRITSPAAQTFVAVTASSNASHGLHVQGGGLNAITDSAFLMNGGYGVLVASGGRALVLHSHFSGNSAGGADAAAQTEMTFCYWDSPTGPAAGGSGSGQSVNGNVVFEPWLVAANAQANRFASALIRNRTFNPSIATTWRGTFQTTAGAVWTATLTDASSAVVRTWTGSGAAAGEIVWDSTDTGGTPRADGTYTYTIESSDAQSAPAAPIRGRVVIDRNKALTVTGMVASNYVFSPNADGVKETTTFSALSNYDDPWLLEIKNASGSTVRSVSGNGPQIAFSWNGQNDGAALEADGTYTATLAVTAGTASDTKTASTILDTVAPVATITAPVAAQILSNIYQSGSAKVSVTGTISDSTLDTWTLDYGSGSAPSSWLVLKTATTPVNASEIFLWDTLSRNNAVYTLRVRATDKGGTTSSQQITLTIGNFKASQNVFQLNSATNGTVTYTSTVPFPVTETLAVKNAAGTMVRTLVNTSRAAGTFNDVWNGRSDSGDYLPDGPYSYSVNVTDGTSSMAWDTSTTYRQDRVGALYPTFPTTFDPFNNVPLVFTYSLDGPYRTSVQVGRDGYFFGEDCAVLAMFATVCLTEWEYQASGTHNFTWWGTAPDGSFLPGKDGANVIYRLDNFPTNVVVLFGTAPKISSAVVGRPLFGPAAADPVVSSPSAGPQTIGFNLSTFQSRTADVTVEFVNQKSVSPLRTITLAAQPAGAISVPWDGKADNGMWVAPGYYTAIITATDTYGSRATQHVVMNVEY